MFARTQLAQEPGAPRPKKGWRSVIAPRTSEKQESKKARFLPRSRPPKKGRRSPEKQESKISSGRLSANPN